MKIDFAKLQQIIERIRGDRPRCMKCQSTDGVGVNQIFGFVVSLCLPHRIEWDWLKEHETSWAEAVRVDLKWSALVAKATREAVADDEISEMIEKKVNLELSGKTLLAKFLGIIAE